MKCKAHTLAIPRWLYAYGAINLRPIFYIAAQT
jgi:hypothetical protein